MANHFRFQFKDYLGIKTHQIDIYKEDAPTVDYTIQYGSSEPVTLSYAGADKNDWDEEVIQAQELEFNFLLPRDDVDELETIFNSQYKDFKLEYKIDGVLEFVGWVKPENLYKRYEKNPPYIEVSFPATDAIADLKTIEFRQDYATIYTGRKRLLEIIKYCIEKIELPLDFKIQLNTYEANRMASTECALDKIYVWAEAFIKESTGEYNATIRKGLPCWDVLERILKSFKIKFKQHKGYYYITNYHQYDNYEFTFAYSTLTQTARIAKNITQDVTDKWYTPNIEQQKVHPLSSTLLIVEDVDAGLPATALDLSQLASFTHTFTSATQNASSISWFSDGMDGDSLELSSTFTIDKGLDTTEHLHIYFEYRRLAYNGTAETMLAVQMQRPGGAWSAEIYYPLYQTQIVNGDTQWVSVGPYPYEAFRILEDGEYNIRITLKSNSSSIKDWTVLQWEMRNMKIQKIIGGVVYDYSPTVSEVEKVYRQVNVTGYEELEVDLMFMDGSESNYASLLYKIAEDSYVATTAWNVTGDSFSLKLIDLYSRYYLYNRSKYKNYLRATVIDRDFSIDIHNVLIIDGIYYTINGWQRNYHSGTLELELVELIEMTSIGIGEEYEEIVEVPQLKSAEIVYQGATEIDRIAYKENHGFVIGDVIRCEETSIDGDPPFYYLAQADTIEHATAIGVVSEIISEHFFKYVSDGYIDRLEFPFERGAYYYLSPTLAGKLTTEPTFEQYEVEQAIGFGTDLGFKVEIDARNLNLKEQVGSLVPRMRTGWPPRMPGTTLSITWSDLYYRLRIDEYEESQPGFFYYLNGNKIRVEQDSDSVGYIIVQFDDAYFGMQYGYIVEAYGEPNLIVTPVQWDNASDSTVFIAAVYWNTVSHRAIYVGHEMHSYELDPVARGTTHDKKFTEYVSGLEITVNATYPWKLDVADGSIRDEDILAEIDYSGFFYQALRPLKAQKLYIDWVDSATQGWFDDNENYDLTDFVGVVDSGGNLLYHEKQSDGTYELIPLEPDEYTAIWVIGTMDWRAPIKIIIGAGKGATLEEAQVNNEVDTFYELTHSIPFCCEEYVLLSRIILVNSGSDVGHEIVDVNEGVADEYTTFQDRYVTAMEFSDSDRTLTLKRSAGLPDLQVVIPGGDEGVGTGTNNYFTIWDDGAAGTIKDAPAILYVPSGGYYIPFQGMVVSPAATVDYNAGIQIQNLNTSTLYYPLLAMYKSNNGGAIGNGHILGKVGFLGDGGAGSSQDGIGAEISVTATDTWNHGSDYRPAKLEVKVNQDGFTVPLVEVSGADGTKLLGEHVYLPDLVEGGVGDAYKLTYDIATGKITYKIDDGSGTPPDIVWMADSADTLYWQHYGDSTWYELEASGTTIDPATATEINVGVVTDKFIAPDQLLASLYRQIHIGDTAPTGNESVWIDTDDDGSGTIDVHVLFEDVEDFTYWCPYAMQLTGISYSTGLNPTIDASLNDTFVQDDTITITPAIAGRLTLTFVFL